MSDARFLAERNLLPTIGPRFFRGESGEVMFEFVIDTANIVGPRPAKDSDREAHALAWREFAKRDVGDGRDESAEESPPVPAETDFAEPPRMKRKYVRRASVEA